MASTRNRQMLLQSRGTRSALVTHPDQFYSRPTTHESSKKARTNSQVCESFVDYYSHSDRALESSRPTHLEEQHARDEQAEAQNVARFVLLSLYFPGLIVSDPQSRNNRRFIVDVDETLRIVLQQEDTDGDFQVSRMSFRWNRNDRFQISVTDSGPKLITLGTATSNGYKTFDIRVRTLSCQ